MRKLFTSAVILGAVLAAVPAVAQSYGGGYGGGYSRDYNAGYGYNNQPTRQIWQLRAAVDRAIRSGQLSRGQSYQLRREFGELQRLDEQFRRDGYSAWERRAIGQRVQSLVQRLRYGRDDRGYGRDDRGYGRDDRGYGRDERRDDHRYSDRNGDGHDDDRNDD